jgi:hypothetical protein
VLMNVAHVAAGIALLCGKPFAACNDVQSVAGPEPGECNGFCSFNIAKGSGDSATQTAV